MKIQMPDGKREVCCEGHKMLACEAMKSGIKMIGCSFFGILYACAVLIVDVGLMTWPHRNVIGFAFRLILCTGSIFTCMYAAIGVFLQQPMAQRVVVRNLCVVEGLRLLTYSLDLIDAMHFCPFCSLTFYTTLSLLLIEVPFAALWYRKMRAGAAQAESAASASAAPAPAQPPNSSTA